MADGPDERLVAGLRQVLGDLRGPEKFGVRHDVSVKEYKEHGSVEDMYRRCFVCDQPFSCHGDWDCPNAEHISMTCSGKEYWKRREKKA